MLIFVLGGARSGKSAVAERLTEQLPAPVTYVATLDAGCDPELAARIAAHKRNRPGQWTTLEVGPDPAALLGATVGTVLLDGLGALVAGAPDFAVDTEALCRALCERDGDTVVVSDEVGLGVHPSTAHGRRFRDALGLVNQRVADCADEVLLVVAGRVLPLERR